MKGGRNDIIDKPRSGRPSSAVTEANKQRVDELIRSDRRVTTSDIIEVIGVSHGSVHNIISDLGYSKVCDRTLQTPPQLRLLQGGGLYCPILRTAPIWTHQIFTYLDL